MKKKELLAKGFKSGDEIAFVIGSAYGAGKVETGTVASDDLHGIIGDDRIFFNSRSNVTLRGVNFTTLDLHARIKDALPVISDSHGFSRGRLIRVSRGRLIRAREIEFAVPIADRHELDSIVAERQAQLMARRDERFRVAEESRARRADAVAQIKEVVGYDITDYLGADPVALLDFAREYHEKKSGQ